MTLIGFFVGFGACVAIAAGQPLLGLALFLVNRLLDGLDGAVARVNGTTDLGAFLDIVLDFLVYSGVILAFAVADPERNALPAAVLITSFVGTGSSFLAYAVIAAKRGQSTQARGRKSIYYLGGLTEGSETMAVLSLMCLIPAWFPVLATLFAFLCWLTVAARIYMAAEAFSDRSGPRQASQPTTSVRQAE
ncbi:MAG: CDP-alcohol phosphatidyltransferase family protein [Geminicoccaceae bacterium]